MVKDEGQVLKRPQDLVFGNQAYFIKCKENQRVLSVKNGSTAAGEEVVQAAMNGKIGQKFMFEAAEVGWYYIRTMTGGYYLSLRGNSTGGVLPGTHVIQDVAYTATSGNRSKDAQKWKIEASDEPGALLISNKLTGNNLLRGYGGTNPHVGTVGTSGENLGKWIFKITTNESNPNANDADIGMIVDSAEFSCSVLANRSSSWRLRLSTECISPAASTNND